MEVLAVKLITGEDVLGEKVPVLSSCIVLKNPVGISIVRGRDGTPNVGFSPFPLHAETKKDSEIIFDNSHVVYYYTPAEDFVKNYEQLFGSGIVLPNKKLVTG